jgi:hypothetical protein
MFASLKTLLIKSLLLCLFFSCTAQADGPLTHYSDYLSFVGQDEKGYLLFALDSNRNVDGDEFQAEHFGVLYEQTQGWVDLVGTGEYPNHKGLLAGIPDSTAFQFSGHSTSGITVQSRINDLRLEINPLTTRLEDNSATRRQNWGIAAAVLYWQGRIIPGRVIYEGLTQHNWDRQSLGYSDSGNNSQGFYLAIQNGSPAVWQDLYLGTAGKMGHLSKGFFNPDREQASIFSPDLEVTKKSWALGFYRWSKRWRMNLQQTATSEGLAPPFASLELKQISRKNLSNWVIGGFAMSVVEGILEINGQQTKVLGFAELVK